MNFVGLNHSWVLLKPFFFPVFSIIKNKKVDTLDFFVDETTFNGYLRFKIWCQVHLEIFLLVQVNRIWKLIHISTKSKSFGYAGYVNLLFLKKYIAFSIVRDLSIQRKKKANVDFLTAFEHYFSLWQLSSLCWGYLKLKQWKIVLKFPTLHITSIQTYLQ